jgi:hypothetical protein
MSDEEWGPWIEHDGKGCPLPDYTIAERMRANGETFVQKVVPDGRYFLNAWYWPSVPAWRRIIRYRIKKPRGLTILENLIADLPAPVQPRVDA